MIAEKEFALISAISVNGETSQRKLSQKAGLSLGLTNIILKRLINRGYLKAKHLDWNKTQYLLTLKGSVEKARKSYAYALFVWDQALKIKVAIQGTVIREYRAGLREGVVVAWPETAEVIRRALAEKDLPGLTLRYVDGFKHLPPDAPTVLLATVETAPRPSPGQRHIPLLDSVDLEFEFPHRG